MPYITEGRKTIKEFLYKNATIMLKKGSLNYLICRLWKLQTASNGVSYDEARKFIGELECAKMEIYRRWVAPYEDKKREENGDI